MAKKTTEQTAGTFTKNKITRPGVHAKKLNSSHKHGKHYTKRYRGQGR
jgi:hypothetical protein